MSHKHLHTSSSTPRSIHSLFLNMASSSSKIVVHFKDKTNELYCLWNITKLLSPVEQVLKNSGSSLLFLYKIMYTRWEVESTVPKILLYTVKRIPVLYSGQPLTGGKRSKQGTIISWPNSEAKHIFPPGDTRGTNEWQLLNVKPVCLCRAYNPCLSPIIMHSS